MIVGVLKEIDDRRVAIDPGSSKKIQGMGAEVWIEKDAGEEALYSDELYQDTIIQQRDDILTKADIVICINPIGGDELKMMKAGSTIISSFAPYFNTEITEELAQYPINVLSMDMIPRTTLAQSMDVLSSMAAIAGYKAVLTAVEYLPRYMPMMITAAGSIKPAKVLVLGAGVAGLQAIATAKRLGAMVEAFDTRAAAKEEVMSLGGKFIEVEGAFDDKGAGGYAVAQSEEYLQKQRALVQERAANADIVITTAQVRGRKAPLLLPKSTVDKMKPGSVVIDLAASTGGNCELTEDNKTIIHNDVYIVGDSNLAAKMPQDASTLYGNNIINYLKIMLKDGVLTLDTENEIIRESLLVKHN